MPVGLYEASVPVFLRYVDRLRGLIRAAESQASGLGLDLPAILDASLAPDMLPFETQVAIAAHFSLRTCFPLAGQVIPPYGEFPRTFEGLHSRLHRAVSLLETLEPSHFEGAEPRIIESQAGSAVVSLRAPEFLFQYALPNFFFHLTTAYAILRSKGVVLGKEQFDGFHAYGPEP